MGGTVGVTIREKDGTLHKMARWTNSLPDFARSMKFINKDKNHFDDYLKVFYEMKADYEKNKNTGKFEFNMTDVYIPYSGHIAPIEYGLVVIDYQTEQILHCQGYTSLDAIHKSEITSPQCYDKKTVDMIQELIDARRVKCQRIIFKEDANYKSAEIALKYVEVDGKLTVVPEPENDKEFWINDYEIDLNPWKIKRFAESKEGFLELKEAIKTLGLEMSEEDEKIWDEFINYRYHNEKDEDQ